MGFFRQFDDFDPLTGQPPGYPFSLLPSIVTRARALLPGRTRDQIINAAHIADWLIDELIESTQSDIVRRVIERGSWELGYLPEAERNEAGVRQLFENWPSEADDPAPHYPTADNTSEIDALRECMGTYALDDDSDFPKGRESEYFAVLALWKIADAIHWLRWNRARVIEESATLLAAPVESKLSGIVYAGQDKEKVRAGLTSAMSLLDTPGLGHTDDKFRYSSAGESALEAMDAVCYAEHLKHTEDLRRERDELLRQIHIQAAPENQMAIAERYADEIVKNRISDANAKAAIKRHAENRGMKKQVLDWCALHLHEYASMDAAAEAIAGKLVPVKFRTARSWIGDYRKQEQSARRL